MAYIGIDFGTSNSVVANFRYGQAEVVNNQEGHKWTPSVVTLRRDGSLAFGQEAKENFDENRSTRSIKRILGTLPERNPPRNLSSSSRAPRIETGERNRLVGKDIASIRRWEVEARDPGSRPDLGPVVTLFGIARSRRAVPKEVRAVIVRSASLADASFMMSGGLPPGALTGVCASF